MLSELFDNIRHTKNSVIPLIQIIKVNYNKEFNSIEIEFCNKERISPLIITESFEIE